jgi:hypothetical protein
MFLEAGVCSISTMSDSVEMISDSDKVVTFGRRDDSHSDGKFTNLR